MGAADKLKYPLGRQDTTPSDTLGCMYSMGPHRGCRARHTAPFSGTRRTEEDGAAKVSERRTEGDERPRARSPGCLSKGAQKRLEGEAIMGAPDWPRTLFLGSPASPSGRALVMLCRRPADNGSDMGVHNPRERRKVAWPAVSEKA